jgi:hypothetical protein
MKEWKGLEFYLKVSNTHFIDTFMNEGHEFRNGIFDFRFQCVDITDEAKKKKKEN